MTIEERNELAKEFFENQCLTTMAGKGTDYAGGEDANRNFKHIAKDLGLTKYQIWAVYFNKHVDALNNAIKRKPENPNRKIESLDESIKDIINYAFILYSMLHENELFGGQDG